MPKGKVTDLGDFKKRKEEESKDPDFPERDEALDKADRLTEMFGGEPVSGSLYKDGFGDALAKMGISALGLKSGNVEIIEEINTTLTIRGSAVEKAREVLSKWGEWRIADCINNATPTEIREKPAFFVTTLREYKRRRGL